MTPQTNCVSNADGTGQICFPSGNEQVGEGGGGNSNMGSAPGFLCNYLGICLDSGVPADPTGKNLIILIVLGVLTFEGLKILLNRST